MFYPKKWYLHCEPPVSRSLCRLCLTKQMHTINLWQPNNVYQPSQLKSHIFPFSNTTRVISQIKIAQALPSMPYHSHWGNPRRGYLGDGHSPIWANYGKLTIFWPWHIPDPNLHDPNLHEDQSYFHFACLNHHVCKFSSHLCWLNYHQKDWGHYYIYITLLSPLDPWYPHRWIMSDIMSELSQNYPASVFSISLSISPISVLVSDLFCWLTPFFSLTKLPPQRLCHHHRMNAEWDSPGSHKDGDGDIHLTWKPCANGEWYISNPILKRYIYLPDHFIKKIIWFPNGIPKFADQKLSLSSCKLRPFLAASMPATSSKMPQEMSESGVES